jgi:hypothetical protein
MQLKEKKSLMERDKRKLESELDKQRQNIGKQVFLQVVQKKSQEQPNEPLTPIADKQTNPNFTQNPSPVNNINHIINNSPLNTKEKETPRRQWDKTKNFIDIENENSANKNLNLKPTLQTIEPANNVIVGASSTSSLSTPSSSASQSPPLNTNTRAKSNDNSLTNNLIINQNTTNSSNVESMAFDLSKAYYSRDEMLKAIDALKEKYVKESNAASDMAAQASSKLNTSNSSKTGSAMVRDIEVLNSKLSELQNEINRLTLLQQKQHQTQHLQAQKFLNRANLTEANSNHNSFNLGEEKKHLSDKENNDKSHSAEVANNTNTDDGDGSFFISFGSGVAKRDKPALTPKKNLIFVKTNNDEKSPLLLAEAKKPANQNTNLLMAAETPKQPGLITLNNDGSEGDIEGSSDGDSAELQRKKELIIQKQLERRQQQEMIRLKREEERARKAEEVRLKEEEVAQKKQLDKTRKETIYQAYIEKKKQLQDESQSGYFGAPQSLLNAKRFHSTQRLKKTDGYSNKQTAALEQQQLKQNLMDQFDQASIFSDRSSTHQFGGQQTPQMIKSKWLVLCYVFEVLVI